MYANSGYGPSFSLLDIGVPDQVAVIEPETGFWALVETDSLTEALAGSLVETFTKEEERSRSDMLDVRFNLSPSAVYFNPTERCNFNCPYCYLPENIRRAGETMSAQRVEQALAVLRDYFRSSLPPGTKPQLIFHGSEPLIAREAVFSAIEAFAEDFVFGIQTNGSLLDDKAIDFLCSHGCAIGLSLDAATEEIADDLRHHWSGEGAFEQLLGTIRKLADYPAFSVITTVTSKNVHQLPAMVDFYAKHGVRTVMFNPVRLTQSGARELKPDEESLSYYFCKALDRVRELRDQKDARVVVANFANLLAGILGPSTRRLMCDISPCGAGRCFFAVSAKGDVYPCSEFIGFAEFCGGSLLNDALEQILQSSPFERIKTRVTEDIHPCRKCALRHFCGAPCPAEVQALTGSLTAPSPYCRFFEEVIRYAFRVIAQGEERTYLWDTWEAETEQVYEHSPV